MLAYNESLVYSQGNDELYNFDGGQTVGLSGSTIYQGGGTISNLSSNAFPGIGTIQAVAVP